jgi:predicted TIM-barrel fold metal-dependent hydrolase
MVFLAEELTLISVDDHIIEPPDLFDGHLPNKYKADAPRIVRREDGADVWRFGEVEVPNVALNAVAGRPKEEYGVEPQSLEEVRPGCFQVDERVKDMSAGGMLASMNFPSFPGFAARLFAVEDEEFGLALVRAYNDWHIDEWCGAHPGRFIPMALPVIWDAQKCADEVRRVSAKGCHSLSFTENPAALGYPSFHDDYWYPLWQAACDTDTVLSIHLGSSGQLQFPSPASPPDVMITLQPMNIQSAAADLLWSRVLKDFPSIKIALSEGGTGWVPYFLERVDRTYKQHHLWTGQDFGDQLPSDVFREHFLTCFIEDHAGIHLRHQIGVDNMSWECDYPHSDSAWPDAPEELARVLNQANVTPSEAAKMTHENAMRWYSFDPFTHLSREEATVGALRSTVPDHDISIQARSTRAKMSPEDAQNRWRTRDGAAGTGAEKIKS